ncbi:MAG TPA: hypothetical protein DHS57_08315 [Erysipelotrichaceae bacterium]|nr:hypothetical protein [Erysipelotrichaceae bacterium]
MLDLNLKEIEYIEESHLYLVNGVITPSVTQILQAIFPSKYEGIPQYILDNKKDFGTNVHEAIENDFKGLDINLSPLEELAYKEYLKLRKKHVINPVYMEEIVAYKDIYAGRLDMIADVNYTRCLIDVKTTATLDKEYLEYQLGYYKLALEDMGIKVAHCYVIWLPKKDKGEFKKIIPKTKNKLMKGIELYEKHNPR